jgi:hypothetical protein
MQSTFSKQVAYNQRVLEAEKEIAGINCDVPHFLEDMSVDEPVFVCINSSEELKRDEQAIAGQLWVQGDLQMTASNATPEGMANTRDSALLYAAAEAVTWNHASQPDEGRKGQRVVIFPKELTQLEAFLATSDPNVDPEDGHPLAYEAILRESSKFETPPLFVKEDSEFVANDPMLAANVPEWLAKSRQVATGNRKRVLESGADVANSSDEDDPKMVADEEHGMYTSEMDPKLGPQLLSKAEVARQRLAAKDMRAGGFADPPQSVRLYTDAQVFPSVEAIDVSSNSKAASSQGEPADIPIMGQQVPNYPIVPYSGVGSRAGSFRPGGGLGSTDTCVAQGNPSKT